MRKSLYISLKLTGHKANRKSKQETEDQFQFFIEKYSSLNSELNEDEKLHKINDCFKAKKEGWTLSRNKFFEFKKRMKTPQSDFIKERLQFAKDNPHLPKIISFQIGHKDKNGVNSTNGIPYEKFIEAESKKIRDGRILGSQKGGNKRKQQSEENI